MSLQCVPLQVCCLPGFRQFTHICPMCNAILGTGKPSHKAGHFALIVILSLITMAVILFIFYVKIVCTQTCMYPNDQILCKIC